MEKITVVLADDHTVVRQGLKALLVAEGDIEISGEAGDGRQAVQMAKKLLPDVVVMDIAMPQLNGLEATRQITRAVPSAKVLVLSSYGDDEYVHGVEDAEEGKGHQRGRESGVCGAHCAEQSLAAHAMTGYAKQGREQGAGILQ